MGILRHYCICSCEERAQRAAPLSYGRSRRTQKLCHLDLLVICLLLTIRMAMQLSKNISPRLAVVMACCVVALQVPLRCRRGEPCLMRRFCFVQYQCNDLPAPVACVLERTLHRGWSRTRRGGIWSDCIGVARVHYWTRWPGFGQGVWRGNWKWKRDCGAWGGNHWADWGRIEACGRCGCTR